MGVAPGDNFDGGKQDGGSSRFAAQTDSSHDTQPVGLIVASDLRKQREKSQSSGAATPSDGILTPKSIFKKKRKATTKGKLSFNDDEDEQDAAPIKKSKSATTESSNADSSEEALPRRRLGANSAIAAPKVLTKAAQLRDAQTRERLRKEFLIMQEAVKAMEFEIPFVFFDGTNNPGGSCRIKKGEHVWLFLDRSRKIGAELGVSGGERAGTRREWARVSVDDLMLVRGEIIIPHHYDFYYFIANKIKSHDGQVLFPYSAETTLPQDNSEPDLTNYNPLTAHENSKTSSQAVVEGSNEDPTFTKVVDRRWYERNKHIFPASAWEEFDATKDYSNTIRRDAEGNAFFFS